MTPCYLQSIAAALALLCLCQCAAFTFSGKQMGVTRTRTSLQAVPLELDGKLDPSKSWDVKFILNGEEKIIKVCEDTSALEAAENSFDDVESSCRNGVCTTCAARITDGRDQVMLAVHGLGEPQIDAGFVCACQTYITGPGVTVLLGQNDEVYEMQYGKFEKSYEMKYSDKKGEIKKGLF